MRDLWSTVKNVHFTLLRIVADDELCSIVYQAEIVTYDDAPDCIASIEVYRIVDGRVVEEWNPGLRPRPVARVRRGDTRMTEVIRPELGFYASWGQPESPRVIVEEIRHAEAVGLGHAFISERFNTKEACTLSGAAAAVSEHIGIATGATNHNTRHPMITAAYALTMHRRSEGRFTLGIGRGVPPLQDAFGMPHITTAQMEDFVGVMRRLFRGETIVGHDGPIGKYPALRLGQDYDVDIPMGLVAIAPNSLEFAGRVMDQVILHTFFTDETLARCVKTVKSSAQGAGRNPDDVKVWPAWQPSVTTSPRKCVYASSSADWPPTFRATATCWYARIAGIPKSCNASERTWWSRASAKAGCR